MSENKWIWFNIGQRGLSGVTWQCMVIKSDFDPKTIRFDNCDEFVKKQDLSYPIHASLTESCKDLNKIAEWCKESYEIEEDVYVGNKNYLHIYDMFDLDNVNKYGVAKSLWD